MAHQIVQDAVNEAQSMGGFPPIGATATTNNFITAGDGQVIYHSPHLDEHATNALASSLPKIEDSEKNVPNGISPSGKQARVLHNE